MFTSSLTEDTQTLPQILVDGSFSSRATVSHTSEPVSWTDAKGTARTGTAVGRNPVSWLIPCHRALRKTGGLGGYHWGLGVKRAMLAWESARADVA